MTHKNKTLIIFAIVGCWQLFLCQVLTSSFLKTKPNLHFPEINEVADYTDDNDDDDFDHLKPDPECKDSEEGQHGFYIQNWAGPGNPPGTCSHYAKLKYCKGWSDDDKIINVPCCTGSGFVEFMKKFCKKSCGFC